MSESNRLRERLHLHRATLRYALEQAAVHGGVAHAPPATRHTIDEARASIRQIKERFRAMSVPVDDGPDDIPSIAPQDGPAPAHSGPFAGQQLSVQGEVHQTVGNSYINSTHVQNVVSGDQFTMSGDFQGAILNIKATLTEVQQSIGATLHGDPATRAELTTLITRLRTALQQVPPEQSDAAEAVAESAKQAVEQATKPKPNKTMVQVSTTGLTQAAQNLEGVLPAILPLAQQIAEVVRKLAGV